MNTQNYSSSNCSPFAVNCLFPSDSKIGLTFPQKVVKIVCKIFNVIACFFKGMYNLIGRCFRSQNSLDHTAIPAQIVKTSNSSPPEAIFIIGAPGSGKTYMRKKIKREHPTNKYVILDVDKERKKIPRYKELKAKQDPNAENLTQGEARALRNRLFKKTQKEGKSYIYDGPGAHFDWYLKLFSEARRQGYHTKLIYVRSNLTTCIERVEKRREIIGRSVPESTIRNFHSQIEQNFPKFKELVDEHEVHNN